MGPIDCSLAALLALFASACGAVEVHKCAAPDGTSIYADSPCRDSAQQQWIRDIEAAPGLGFAYSVRITDDDALLTAHERWGLEQNAIAALKFWARTATGSGRLDVRFDATHTTDNGRFQGACVKWVPAPGKHHYECGSTFELRTGVDPNGANEPDIVVKVNVDRMRRNSWIDPEPGRRHAAVPADKVDLVSVLAHEIGHGLGFIGWARQVGVSREVRSRFDSYLEAEGDALYFTGSHAMQANANRPVRLCAGGGCDPTSRVYHLDHPPTFDAAGGATGLMYGRYFPSGARVRLAQEEVGVFRDLGLVFLPPIDVVGAGARPPRQGSPDAGISP